MKNILFIYNEIGDSCVTKCDGKRLYLWTRDYLKNNETITLDFSGVIYFSSSFFYVLIGNLIKEFGWDKYKNLLTLDHLNEDGESKLDTTSKAIKLYLSNDNYKEIVDSILLSTGCN